MKHSHGIFSVVVFSLLIVTFNCKGQQQVVPQKNDSSSKMRTNIKRDIPLTDYGKPPRLYSSVNNLSTKLNIDTLSNGYDSLQIKLWVFPNYQDKGNNVLIIK